MESAGRRESFNTNTNTNTNNTNNNAAAANVVAASSYVVNAASSSSNANASSAPTTSSSSSSNAGTRSNSNSPNVNVSTTNSNGINPLNLFTAQSQAPLLQQEQGQKTLQNGVGLKSNNGVNNNNNNLNDLMTQMMSVNNKTNDNDSAEYAPTAAAQFLSQQQQLQLQSQQQQPQLPMQQLAPSLTASILSPSSGQAGDQVCIDLRMLPAEIADCRHQIVANDVNNNKNAENTENNSENSPDNQNNANNIVKKSVKLSFGTLAVDTIFTRGRCMVATDVQTQTGLQNKNNLQQQHQLIELELLVSIVPAFEETGWFDSFVPVQALIIQGEEICSMVHIGMFQYTTTLSPNGTVTATAISGASTVSANDNIIRPVSLSATSSVQTQTTLADAHPSPPDQKKDLYLLQQQQLLQQHQQQPYIQTYKPQPQNPRKRSYSSESAETLSQQFQMQQQYQQQQQQQYNQNPNQIVQPVQPHQLLFNSQQLVNQPQQHQVSVAGITPPLTPHAADDCQQQMHMPLSNYYFVQDDFDNVLAAPWSPREVHAGRRIVLLEPSLRNGITVCRCRPVEDIDHEGLSRERGDILISCIYWPSENQFIVTGVDIIYAMEQLLHVDYNTEKKNRVRRNLEKFDPRTVSKTNPAFYDFFWKIMSYGDPKPRNIEANVKVYPWIMLTEALARILEKFGPNGSFKARASSSGTPVYQVGIAQQEYVENSGGAYLNF